MGRAAGGNSGGNFSVPPVKPISVLGPCILVMDKFDWIVFAVFAALASRE
jgi:hypothetical protein